MKENKIKIIQSFVESCTWGYTRTIIEARTNHLEKLDVETLDKIFYSLIENILSEEDSVNKWIKKYKEA